MTAPIDRIENIRASVEDIQRQMEACRFAGVTFPQALTWRLLSECISLLGKVDSGPTEAQIEAARAEGWDACAEWNADSDLDAESMKAARADAERAGRA